jgi:cell division protein FtsQ
MINRTVRLLVRHLGRHKIATSFVAVLLLSTLLMSGSLGPEVRGLLGQIDYVSVTGDLNNQQITAVEQLLVAGTSRLSDIERVKEVLEAVSWINTVQVRLNWPDEIVIQVVPEQAIAYWNDNAFINSAGIVFESGILVAGDLPQLYGPVGKEKAVMGHYQRLNRALAKTGHFIEVLSLNERGSLDFKNQHGVEVSLGNVDIENRLQRFIKVSRRIALYEAAPRMKRIDTRYPNGVAVEFDKSGPDFQIAETFKLQREVSL